MADRHPLTFRKPLIIGLTGSIGMGKSAVAAMLESLGVPVFDADAAVHHLQGPGGALVPVIEARFPGTTGSAGVDRQKLGALVLGRRAELAALEAIVHPAVAAMREQFLRQNRAKPMLCLDIPLLFETKAERRVDHIVVVSAPCWVQQRRVLARPGMTMAKFRRIRSLQMPDAAKRLRADSVIDTGQLKSTTRRDVAQLVRRLRASLR